MNNNGNIQAGWRLWSTWFLANTFGWFVSWYLLTQTNLFSFTYRIFGSSMQMYHDSLILGLFVGTMQWLVLRKYFFSTGWWIIVTIIGIILSSEIISQVSSAFDESYFARVLMIGTITGGSIGIMQWIVIRKRISKHYWWPIGNTIGYAAGSVVFFIIIALVFLGNPMFDKYVSLIHAMRIFISAAFQGAISGFILLHCQQMPK